MVGLKYTRENNQNNDLAIYHDFNFLCELSPIGFLDIFKQCDLQRDVSNPKSLVTLSLLFSCQVFSERSETTSRKVDTFFNGLSLHWTIFFQASSSSSSILKKVTKHFLEEKSFLFFAVLVAHWHPRLCRENSHDNKNRRVMAV